MGLRFVFGEMCLILPTFRLVIIINQAKSCRLNTHFAWLLFFIGRNVVFLFLISPPSIELT